MKKVKAGGYSEENCKSIQPSSWITEGQKRWMNGWTDGWMDGEGEECLTWAA